MKHHFSLSFKVNERHVVDVDKVAGQMTGSDFHFESNPLNGTEFSVHFVREGVNTTELLEYARHQVMSAVPGAELVAMDMSEELPMMGAVDDITKIVIQACQLFNDAEFAHAWLSKPQEQLNGQIPKVLMVDAQGRSAVSKVLTQLASQASSNA